MQRALGVGGLFFRAKDQQRLIDWYRDMLGVETMAPSGEGGVWQQEAGPTVVSPMAEDTDYFGRRDQQYMVNFRVADLDAMLEQLRAAGAAVVDEVQAMEGVGRFGWVNDPEGNRIELWEPATG